jgi:hypothetical protein
VARSAKQKGGEILALVTAKRSTSTKASTAALDQIGQRLLLPQRRVPRHPASGQVLHEMKEMNFEFARRMQESLEEQVSCVEERAVNAQRGIQTKRKITSARLNLCRRIVASALLGVLTILLPAIASAGPAPHREVRVPRIDGRAIDSLQRWAGDEEEYWREEA